MPLITSDTFVSGTSTVSVAVLAEGRSRQAKAKVSVREIPGGDVIVVNNGGLGAQRRRLTFYVANETGLASLESLLGESATLTYDEGSLTCVMEELDAGDYWIGGEQKVHVTLLQTA